MFDFKISNIYFTIYSVQSSSHFSWKCSCQYTPRFIQTRLNWTVFSFLSWTSNDQFSWKKKIELISKIFFQTTVAPWGFQTVAYDKVKNHEHLFMTHFFAIQNRKSHLRKRVRLHRTCFLPQRLRGGVLRDFHIWTCFLLGLRDGVLRDFRRSLWKCEGPMY